MSPRLALLRSQADERLVGLARAGDERAFAAIVERYGPELHAFARTLCSDGRSEDVLQQAFLSAFVALSAGSEVRHLRGWLYQIVRNAASRQPGPLGVPLDRASASVTSVEDVVQERALAMTTLSELARLPARQRQAMIGTALDGRARAEIASSMGLSEGAVRQLVHRARTALRSAVTAVTPWPVARWIASIRPGAPGTAELATGAGAASSGGLAIKLGAVLASGTLLTGAAIDLRAAPVHRHGGPAATTAQAPRHAVRTRGAVVASPAPRVSVDLMSSAGPAGIASQTRRDAQSGAGARHDQSGLEGRASGDGRSGGRNGGQPARYHDGNRSGPSGGQSTGDGGNSSGDGGRDGAQSLADQTGGDHSGSGSRTGAGSDGVGDAQMTSDSNTFDSAVDGSGFSGSSGSGEGSGSVDGSGAPGSSSFVGTSGGSGSGDHVDSGSGGGGATVGGDGETTSGGDGGTTSGGDGDSSGD